MARCEDFPCCGHTPDDPCGPQPYDRPGFYDVSIPGNEHALCNHEEGECNVDDYDEEDDEVESHLHAHVEETTTDCDGRIDRDYVYCKDEGESDDAFRGRVVLLTISLVPEFGARLEVDEDGDLEWSERTDEGSRHRQVRFCVGPCNTTAHGYRDHRAEAAGY